MRLFNVGIWNQGDWVSSSDKFPIIPIAAATEQAAVEMYQRVGRMPVLAKPASSHLWRHPMLRLGLIRAEDMGEAPVKYRSSDEASQD